MYKKIYYLLIIIIMFTVQVCYSASAAKTKDGQEALDFRLRICGTQNKVTLSDLLDGETVVVISFFNVGCQPCLKEIPIVTKVQKLLFLSCFLLANLYFLKSRPISRILFW